VDTLGTMVDSVSTRAMNPTALWGEVRQLGYVVPAHLLTAHVQHWARTMGVGPWLIVEHPPVDDFVHHGQPGQLDFTIAITHMGALQVELIAQHNEQPSTYLDFLHDHPDGGLHHIAYWPTDMDAAEADAETMGWDLWSGGRIGPNGRFRYYDTGGAIDGFAAATADAVAPLAHGGTVVELAEVTGSRLDYFQNHFAELSRMWDPRTDDLLAPRRAR
jgi:hypothetical protein